MRPGGPRSTAGGGSSRLLPLLLVPVALLANPAAALPVATYYLGELSGVFLPLRLLAARELSVSRPGAFLAGGVVAALLFATGVRRGRR